MASLLRRTNQFSRLVIRRQQQQHKFSSSCASSSAFLSSLLKRDSVSSSTKKIPTPTCPFHSSPCRCFSSSSSNKPSSTPTCPIHSTSPCRCFSSSSSASVKKQPVASDVKLSQVMDSQIQYGETQLAEQECYQGGLLPDGFPFEVIDNPGEQTITLKRELNGESIEVVVHNVGIIDGEVSQGEDDKITDQCQISFVVTVTKGDGPRLEFTCLAYSEGIFIDSMVMKGPEGSSKELPYEGPEFTDLDVNLNREFNGYLERRGINISLQQFLQEYMLKKDGKEYVQWLKNMKEFVQM